MIKLALFLLLAASGPVVLTDDVYQLPGGEWRWVRFEIRPHHPASVVCRFETVGSGEARAELVSRPDLELIREHKPHDALASTGTGRAATFNQLVQEPGEYAVVIENPEGTPVAARLNVALSFTPQDQSLSQSISRNRRLTVIVVSFVMFFAIVTFSARALLKAMRKT